MSLRHLQDKLLSAARANPPGDSVPYSFEQRVMARLKTRPPQDLLGLWSAALWRAAFACLLVTVLSGVWSMWATERQAAEIDFSQEFESAVVMAEPNFDEVW